MYDPFNRNDHQKIDLKHCYNSFEYPEDGQNGQESQAVNRFLGNVLDGSVTSHSIDVSSDLDIVMNDI